MSEKRVLEILRSCDALLEGHFRYTSGRHGKQYFEKIRIVREPRFVDELGRMMAVTMDDIRNEIDLVCAPAYGAVVFGFATALHMGKSFAFLQRDSKTAMTLRAGFRDLVRGSRVLLVEDVCTTGGSIVESIEALRAAGADVVQVGLIVDRTGGNLELEVPYRSLLTVEAVSWNEEECPLCMDEVPITVPGSSGKG
ncbi:MAG: orotate phosphoribosyltransferase [Candidatus Fermentibacteraceae bacterium]|nr:orotate phosphoribosyltransferase [Candidatus Fermentibacteraceae bacterium]MBN2608973.1 orotate phosphoribosyltransferase [Candidatus Fermentibacteraceae bacterium]